MMIRGHLWPRLQTGAEGRRTGLGTAFLIAPMVISGVGIQVATSPVWRTGLAWVHGISSGAFLLAYFGHLALRGWQPASLLVSRRQQG